MWEFLLNDYDYDDNNCLLDKLLVILSMYIEANDRIVDLKELEDRIEMIERQFVFLYHNNHIDQLYNLISHHEVYFYWWNKKTWTTWIVVCEYNKLAIDQYYLSSL